MLEMNGFNGSVTTFLFSGKSFLIKCISDSIVARYGQNGQRRVVARMAPTGMLQKLNLLLQNGGTATASCINPRI